MPAAARRGNGVGARPGLPRSLAQLGELVEDPGEFPVIGEAAVGVEVDDDQAGRPARVLPLFAPLTGALEALQAPGRREGRGGRRLPGRMSTPLTSPLTRSAGRSNRSAIHTSSAAWPDAREAAEDPPARLPPFDQLAAGAPRCLGQPPCRLVRTHHRRQPRNLHARIGRRSRGDQRRARHDFHGRVTRV